MEIAASVAHYISILNHSIALMSSWADRIKTDLSDYNYDVEKTEQAKEYRLHYENMINGAMKLRDELSTGASSAGHNEVFNYKMFAERRQADCPEGVLIKPSQGYRKYLLRVL